MPLCRDHGVVGLPYCALVMKVCMLPPLMGEQLASGVAFGGAFEFKLFSREDLGPSVGQQVLISLKLLLLFLEAVGRGDKPAFKTLLFDGILRHDEFVVVEACLVSGGRYVIIILDLFVCRSLVRACFCILLR